MDRWTFLLKHKGLVASFSRRHGLNVDDHMAAGLLILFDALPSYDPSKGAFSTWAFYRLRRLLVPAARIEEYVDQPDMSPGADDVLVHQEQMRAVAQALDSLTPMARSVLQATVVEGRPDVACKELRRNRGSIGRIRKKSLAQLRARLVLAA